MSLDHTWMKGVPMELRPRYYPKPPLKFKDIDIYIPLDAIENDYDFAEERRILTECKQYEEVREKERLAEEERQRQLEEEAERLRLEEEERREQERLRLEEAEAANATEELSEDQDKLLSDDVNSRLNIGDKIVAEDDSGVVPNHSSNSSSSKPNSPVSEEIANSQPLPTTGENYSALSTLPSLNHPQLQSINGYHYMMNSDLQLNMYHHIRQPAVPQYYNYYVPQPHHPQVAAPISIPQPQQHQHPQTQPQQQQHAMIQSHLQSQPGSGTAAAPAPALPYPTNPQSSGPPQPPAAPYMLHPTANVGTTSVPPTSTTPCQPTTPVGNDSGTNSPAGSEKSSSGQNQHLPQPSQSLSAIQTQTVVPTRKKVDLSDFESEANPFDNAELKSINDMEMLASVLKHHHAPMPHPNSHSQAATPATVTPTPDSQTTSTGSSSYINGGGGGYYQPTPIYPPASTQCPYPTQATWNTNGYYPPVSVSSPPVSTTSVPTNSSNYPPPQQTATQQSHIPSPTQAIEQPQAAAAAPQAPPQDSINEVNSFTKLHFPFLTSMAASSARGNRSYMPQSSSNSSDDIASQNPFLSTYVQSHSPMHQHQYWPGQLSQIPPQPPQQNPFSAHHTAPPVQNGPLQQSVQGTGFIPSSGHSTVPTAGSQHALR